MEKKTYQLVGTINILGEVPDFIHAVFMCEGKYYLQHCSLSTIIDTFVPIEEEEVLACIRPVQENMFQKEAPHFFQKGDPAMIAYQYGENDVFLGDIDSYVQFSKTVPPSELVEDKAQVLREDSKKNKQYQNKYTKQK